MTELKHEIAASTSRFRQGYQDETVLLSMVLEGDRNSDGCSTSSLVTITITFPG